MFVFWWHRNVWMKQIVIGIGVMILLLLISMWGRFFKWIMRLLVVVMVVVGWWWWLCCWWCQLKLCCCLLICTINQQKHLNFMFNYKKISWIWLFWLIDWWNPSRQVGGLVVGGGRAASAGQHSKQFALKFRFPLITFSLGDQFISYSHTLLLRSLPFQKHATLWHWPSDDLDI